MAAFTDVLELRAGARALATLRERGLVPEAFSTVLGASGGPKWLILYGIDKVLGERWLRPARLRAALVGSSIGSWRHACLAQADPGAALDRFADAYVGQRYRGSPPPSKVTEQAAEILEKLLGGEGATQIARHERLHTHVIAARCRGLMRSEAASVLGLGLGLAAATNALHRSLLAWHFQRALFHTGPNAAVSLDAFTTHTVPLGEHNLRPALLASGAIPLVLAGVTQIEGAPDGVYRDGGMVDYHFDFAMQRPAGLCLFPHFTGSITPGWFDKGLPWRRIAGQALDEVVLIAPSRALVRGLHGAKIPDRNDFRTFDVPERLRVWTAALDASRRMGDAFSALLDDPDPARHFAAL